MHDLPGALTVHLGTVKCTLHDFSFLLASQKILAKLYRQLPSGYSSAALTRSIFVDDQIEVLFQG